MARKAKSPKRSFKGWKLSAWAKGNADLVIPSSSTVKEYVKLLIPLLIAYFVTQNWVVSGFDGILGKFVLDSVEYWWKER